MAFSCRTLWLARRHFLPPTWSKGRTFTSSGSSRHAATTTPTWHAATSLPTSRVQIYTSHSHDPYLNLSAEHFLLQHSHPDSTILFLYTNDPCVVIGRNQNPWLEVNLGLLLSSSADADADADDNKSPEHVRLVRRRSGGGAVFHDRGNVNYSVICPPAVFDRNKHAEMVVRALRGLGVVTAHVNARHDIVILNNENNNDEHENSSPSSFSSSSSSSSFSSQSEGGSSTPSPATFKISGSAYKLTRLRSLHHGTCLLSSPHLAQIGRYLRAPAAPYLKARGVESVRSPIRNVGVATEAFMEGVTREFVDMYGRPDVQVALGRTEGDDDDGGAGSVVGGGGGGDFAHEQIQKGYRELTSLEWLYTQTPQFTFSTHPIEDDPRERPPLPPSIPKDFRATITARHGEIQHADISGFDGSPLQGQLIHTITDWRQVLTPHSGDSSGSAVIEPVGTWLNHLFGKKQ